MRLICTHVDWASAKPTVTCTSNPRAVMPVTTPVSPPDPVRRVQVVRTHRDAAELRRRSEKTVHERVDGLVVEVGRFAGLLDSAFVHDQELVGDLHGLVLVVGHEDRRHVDLLVELLDPRAELRADLRVERAERLVEE